MRPSFAKACLVLAVVLTLLTLAGSASAAGVPTLERRVDRLEQQLTQLQATLKDLQAQSAQNDAALSARIDALEKANAALRADLERLGANPALALGPYVSVSQDTVSGQPGPNIVFTGASVFTQTQGGLFALLGFPFTQTPAVPQNLVAQGHDSVDRYQVTLKWSPTDYPGFAGYRVYESSHATGPWSWIDYLEEPTFTDRSPRGPVRYYAVSSFNRLGAESAKSSVVTPLPPPTLPGPDRVCVYATQGVGQYRVEVGYEPANAKVSGARLYRSDSEQGPWTMVAKNDDPYGGSLITDTAVGPGEQPFYSLCFYDAFDQESEHSTPVKAQALPSTPTNFVAYPSAYYRTGSGIFLQGANFAYRCDTLLGPWQPISYDVDDEIPWDPVAAFETHYYVGVNRIVPEGGSWPDNWAESAPSEASVPEWPSSIKLAGPTVVPSGSEDMEGFTLTALDELGEVLRPFGYSFEIVSSSPNVFSLLPWFYSPYNGVCGMYANAGIVEEPTEVTLTATLGHLSDSMTVTVMP